MYSWNSSTFLFSLFHSSWCFWFSRFSFFSSRKLSCTRLDLGKILLQEQNRESRAGSITLHLACTGSQSQCRICFILTVHRASHIINNLHQSHSRKVYIFRRGCIFVGGGHGGAWTAQEKLTNTASPNHTKTTAPQIISFHRTPQHEKHKHRKIWDHRNSANWDFIHRIIKTSTPQIPMSPSISNSNRTDRSTIQGIIDRVI